MPYDCNRKFTSNLKIRNFKGPECFCIVRDASRNLAYQVVEGPFETKKGMHVPFFLNERNLRGFNQLHFAALGAVQHFHFALVVAEDENFAVAKFAFLNGLFQGHGGV